VSEWTDLEGDSDSYDMSDSFNSDSFMSDDGDYSESSYFE